MSENGKRGTKTVKDLSPTQPSAVKGGAVVQAGWNLAQNKKAA
jgi:hypothetical protein